MIKEGLIILLCLPMIGFGQCVPPDGCQNEKGTYAYDSGNQYVGEWKNGKRDGQGTYTWEDGGKYKGKWKNNKLWNGVKTSYGNNKGESGLVIIYKYKNGSITDTIRNDRNFYNKEDIIGENLYSIIQLIDKKTKYDIILQINNTTVKWCFDTGSEGFSIAKSQWDKIKSKIDFEDLHIIRKSKGVGGHSSGTLIRIKDKIEIGGYLVKNAIISISNDDYSLMGIGFLKKFSNVEWNMKEATLKIYK